MSYGGGEWVNTVCELDIENRVDLVLRLFDQKSNMRQLSHSTLLTIR